MRERKCAPVSSPLLGTEMPGTRYSFAGPPSELVAPGGEGHAGMVCVPTSFRLTRAATGKIVEELEVPLARYPGDADLANGETWISAELTG
jgi:hypothetical protein